MHHHIELKKQLGWKTRLGFAIILATSLIRAFRFPNEWSTGNWRVSYELGFVKRGFIGEITAPLQNLGELQTTINLLATTTTLIWALGLLLICYQITKYAKDKSTAALGCAAVLASSYAIMGAHTNGYFDAVTFTIAATACYFATRQKYFIAGCLLGVGALCHETITLYGAPAVAFAAILTNHQESEKKVWKAIALVTLPVITTVTALLMFRSNINEEVWLKVMVQKLEQEGFTHTKHVQVLHGITQSFLRYWEIQHPHFARLITEKKYWVQIGLPAAAMGTLIAANLPNKNRLALTYLAILCILAPLAIHAIAWDTSRIWTYSIGNGLLILWVTTLFYKNRENETPLKPWTMTICGTAFAAAVTSNTELMDFLQTRGTWHTALLGYLPGLALIIWDWNNVPQEPTQPKLPKIHPEEKTEKNQTLANPIGKIICSAILGGILGTLIQRK